MKDKIEVVVADESHEKYVDTILETISEAAKVRGTGIAKRTHEYLVKKMREVTKLSKPFTTEYPQSSMTFLTLS